MQILYLNKEKTRRHDRELVWLNKTTTNKCMQTSLLDANKETI